MMISNLNSTQLPNSFSSRSFLFNTSLLFSLILFFAYALIFLIGLVANIFVIVVIIKYRRMRTLTNRFLLNLALSDLLATLICLPPTAYHHYDKRWIFGEFLCRFVPFIQGTSVAVSVFTLMAVSVDRFVAIHKPIYSKLLCTPTKILLIIAIIWLASFVLMIPLIVHHRIIDPFDITLTACAEEWHQNMNARLVYDFLLLFVLFILPLTLMSYCYIRISFSLWFIDSKGRRSLSTSSTTNAARFSTISEDYSPEDAQEFRRASSQKKRPYYIHYHKNYDIDSKRKQHQQLQKDEYRLLMNASTAADRARRSITTTESKPKSLSITTMTTTAAAANIACRRSSSLIGRPLGENGFVQNYSTQVQQGRAIPTRHRNSTSPYTSGIARSSLTSLQSQNRIHRSISLSANANHHRSIVDVERASRFLQSRRRIVKLLITLVIVFFVTRLPLNILSIYIDLTSNTYLPDPSFANRSKPETMEEAAAAFSSHISHTDKKMTLVLYVNPLLQLLSLSNSAINPLCYCLMSHAVKNIVTLIRQKLHRRGQKKAAALPLTQRAAAPNQSIKMIAEQQNSQGID